MKNQLRFKVKNITGNNAFSLCNDVLMYAERIVITALLQRRMLNEFHIGHLGIFRMKFLMRCYIYWPKMDQDIENLVKSCRGFALAAKSLHIKIQPWPKTKTDMPYRLRRTVKRSILSSGS